MRLLHDGVAIVPHGLENFRVLELDVLVEAALRAVGLAAAVDEALVMACDFRGGPPDSSFFFINLSTVAIR